MAPTNPPNDALSTADDPVIHWLVARDPAIRWQVMRDLLAAPAAEGAAERVRGQRLVTRRLPHVMAV